MITIVSDPSKEIPYSGGIYSYWVALHNSIIFKCQRQDYEVISITPTAGNPPTSNCYLITLSQTPTSSDFTVLQVTDYIFLSYTSITTGLLVQKTFLCYYANNMYIEVIESGGLDDIDPYFPAFINVLGRDNWHCKIDVINTNSTWELLDSLDIYDDTKGILTIIAQEIVKSMAGYENWINYGSNTNQKDTCLSGAFIIQYNEYWKVSGSQISGILAGNLYNQSFHFVNTVRQIGRSQNLYKYVFANVNSQSPLFLTGFSQSTDSNSPGGQIKGGTMFLNSLRSICFPFDLAFIFSELCDLQYGYDFTIKEYDINGGYLGYQFITLDSSKYGFVNRIPLPIPQDNNTTYYICSISAFDNNTHTEVNTSDFIRVDIEAAPPYPVYLAWLSKDGDLFNEVAGGCWDYWCFGYRNLLKKDVKDGEIIEIINDDVATATGRSEMLTKISGQKLVIGCEAVPVDKIKAIQQLTDSVQVLMLMSSIEDVGQNDVRWIKVQIEAGSFNIQETDSDYSGLELIVILPELYNQVK